MLHVIAVGVIRAVYQGGGSPQLMVDVFSPFPWMSGNVVTLVLGKGMDQLCVTLGQKSL